MRRFFKSGLFVGFAAAALVIVGVGVYGLLAGISPTPLVQGVRAVVTPLQRAFTAAADWTEDKAGYFTRYRTLEAEVETLRAKLLAAESDIRAAAQLIAENERLRALLDMEKRHGDLDLAAAEIIASETGNWGYTYTIDLGSADGVAVGQAVLAPEGLAGVVRRVGETWADFSPVTATDFKAGAMVSRTREIAVLEGSFALMRRGCLKLSYLPQNPKLAVGDLVETSGSGGTLPRGLIVGTVLDLAAEPDGVSVYAVIQPAAELPSLTRVFVVRAFDQMPDADNTADAGLAGVP